MLCLTALALMSLATAASAKTMYARTRTKVRDGTRLSSQVIGELAQGDAVQTQGMVGKYYKVLFGGNVGYVYHNKLTEDKPEDIAVALARDPATRALKLAELETGGAMRGLSKTGMKYADKAHIPQWARNSVDQMRARAISAEHLEAFARSGRLGEYAEGQ